MIKARTANRKQPVQNERCGDSHGFPADHHSIRRSRDEVVRDWLGKEGAYVDALDDRVLVPELGERSPAFRETGQPRTLTEWRAGENPELAEALSASLLERAIGVIYQPALGCQKRIHSECEMPQSDNNLLMDGLHDEMAVEIGPLGLKALLGLGACPRGIVIFAHGSGSGRFSPRNAHVAQRLRQAGLATLLLDLLTPEEEQDRRNVFDVRLLAQRWSFRGHGRQHFPTPCAAILSSRNGSSRRYVRSM